MYASVDLEGVGSDGVDGPPQALDGSVVAGGVGCGAAALGAPAVGPVAERAGVTEQRIRQAVADALLGHSPTGRPAGW